ncbi:MAG: hypothetical protein ACI87E_001551 [Mariniblastus sp.]|jgi:hypothetical protein
MACKLWRLTSTGSLLTAGSGSSISAVLARSASATAIREVVIEDCGIACVPRLTDSLRKYIVQQMDGVEGCSFAYLPKSENEATKFNADTNQMDLRLEVKAD